MCHRAICACEGRAESYRQRIEALVEEAAPVRRRSGSRVLGIKAILAQDPSKNAWHPFDGEFLAREA